jgi:DNA-binding NarL/FixJ family response regulator
VVTTGLTHMLLEARAVPVIAPRSGDPESGDLDLVLVDLAALTHDELRHRLRELVVDGVPVVGVATGRHAALTRGALVLGATAVVPERISGVELSVVVHDVARGLRPRPPTTTERLTPLTGRELGMLRLVAAGQTNEMIAASSHLSVNSVKTYIRIAYRKIRVARRSEAVVWAIEHGQGVDAPPPQRPLSR